MVGTFQNIVSCVLQQMANCIEIIYYMVYADMEFSASTQALLAKNVCRIVKGAMHQTSLCNSILWKFALKWWSIGSFDAPWTQTWEKAKNVHKPDFQAENVHVIMCRKGPIFCIQYGLVNIMWTYLQNLDLSTEWEPLCRIITCPDNVELITECLYIHRLQDFLVRIRRLPLVP